MNFYLRMLIFLLCLFLPPVAGGESVRQWHRRPGFNPRSSHSKNSKMILDGALLNTWYYKVRIKCKVEQSRERSSSLPYTTV